VSRPYLLLVSRSVMRVRRSLAAIIPENLGARPSTIMRERPRPTNTTAKAVTQSLRVNSNFVRRAAVRCALYQCQLCGRSCHCPVQFECPQMTADIPNFDASLPANFSTHQVKSISFADFASWVTDQIPIAARHAGHPRIPSFR